MKKSPDHFLMSACLGLALSLWSVPASAQWVTFEPFHKNGIYALGERVGWTLRGPLSMSQGPEKFDYTIRKNNADIIKTGTVDLSSGMVTIETALDEPAMLYVRLNVAGEPAPATISRDDMDKLTLGAAIAPTSLKPVVARPADFDTFWAAKRKLLAAVPINPKLTPLASERSGTELYNVQLDSLNSHVRGYLAKPNRAGKFPALIIYQYAGVYALQPPVATDRAAEGWLTFDVNAHDMAPDQADGAPANYGLVGATDRETSYFLNMYLRDTRAIDYIQSRPDWDGKTIVVMGTSMGGQQSLAMAGLNPDRVTALIVDVPSGADSNGDLHGRKTGYPGWPSDDPRVMNAALYFDPVNFASRITAPSLVGFGFIDTVSPPAGVWTMFNQMAGPKEAVPMVGSDHISINHVAVVSQAREAYYRRSREALEALRTTGTFHPNENWADAPLR